MTPKGIIERAARGLNVIAPNGQLSDSEYDDAFEDLKELVAAWNRENYLLYKTIRTTKVWASGTASYTVGSSGNINIVMPDKLMNAGVIIPDTDPEVELPLAIALNGSQWAQITIKTLTNSLLRALFYNPGASSTATLLLGTLYGFPIPTQDQTVAIYTPGKLTSFANIDEEIILPDGYLRAIRTNLALEIAPRYTKANVTELLVSQARDSKAALKIGNNVQQVLRCPDELTGYDSYYNYRTDMPT